MILLCQTEYIFAVIYMQGRIQDFKLGGTHLKELRRAEGGTKFFWVFRVKNHDFTSTNHIFSNFRGGGGGACAGCAAPVYVNEQNRHNTKD